MTLAQVQASVAFIAFMVVTWAGLMMGVALLLPKQSKRASDALSGMTWVCGATGIGMMVLVIIGFALINAPSPLIKLAGMLWLLALGGVLSIGGAGIALLMGDRIGELSGAKTSFSALVRGSAVYSLAVGFPFIGWMLFAPLSVLFALGAGVVALWPSRLRSAPPVAPPGSRPDYDVLERQGAM